MKESHKRNRNPKYKKQYKVINWPQTDQSLQNRGSLTLWISPEAIDAWQAQKTGKRGKQPKYSDFAIETVLSLRLILNFPLRQVEGFVRSLFELMRLQLPVPDHTTLSRRSQNLNPLLNRGQSTNGALHLIVDSTGLSIHGEGPWATGKKKRMEKTPYHGRPRRTDTQQLCLKVDHKGCKSGSSFTRTYRG